jgi:hypothetical protein
VIDMDREGRMRAPEFWIGESPYDVVERRPEVVDYVARDGRQGRWRRLVQGQDPVAVFCDDASISWRIFQNSIGMTVGVRGNQSVEVSQVGFCPPDLLPGARLR